MNVTLCRRLYTPKKAAGRATTVEVIAERRPLGTHPRYLVRSVIHSAGRDDIGRSERMSDEPEAVIRALDAADYEVGELMVMSRETVIGGADPDARFFA